MLIFIYIMLAKNETQHLKSDIEEKLKVIPDININISKDLKETIDSIENINTFTVTTGHQLSLFTGPLYFLYKMNQTSQYLCLSL